ncbi:hypothetical protein [Nostoc sp. 106C]|uniref:hypothetical protein n=1 Tax=Nostoc sp. 106C TaxID=1932667 RepID=UPI000A35EC0B|nr:hypothetical protein [Nostoc sp. 106C]OUL33637.1 hypothetical protein BV375_06990 [Nostoc sp. 106C]
MSDVQSEDLPIENKRLSGQEEYSAVKNEQQPKENSLSARPWTGIRQYTNQLSPKLANPGYIKSARQIYDRLRGELINNYSGWYVAIEPDSGDYFLNATKALAQQQARQQHPFRLICTFKLIATGAS